MQKRVLKRCHIYQTLRRHAKKPHLSFHTPGHKRGGWDVTELSYTDNLACPQGCILQAERDVAHILGSAASFLLTDGSTCGVHAMLYAARALGAKRIALADNAHQSVFYGCEILGLTPLVFPTEEEEGIPLPPTLTAVERVAEGADALLLTSPDYYGNIPDLATLQAYCKHRGKLLLIDGAHGGHLHFDGRYAGNYADMWVDGVHKSLPALTQGGVVSARETPFVAPLREGVLRFRTTSPSYPIMASVEYAVKYPRNLPLEGAVRTYAAQTSRARLQEDWTKLCILFGENACAAAKELEKRGVYAEFCDGNVVEFYLSPATSLPAFKRLTKLLSKVMQTYPYIPKKVVERNPAPLVCVANLPTEWVDLGDAVGLICAAACGLFPPCIPLLQVGEGITEEKIARLRAATNVYGLMDKKILVVKE